MKSILIICVTIFIPALLICQNPLHNPLSRGPLKNPHLFANTHQQMPQNILKIYNSYQKFHKYFESQVIHSAAIKQSLDSIIYDPADELFVSRKSAYTYNMDGQQTTVTDYEWDEMAETWSNITRVEWNYDMNKRNNELISYYGDGLNWVKELKYENIYDVFNQIITVNGYGWNDLSGQWELGLKIEYTYDLNGKVLTTILYEWDSSNSVWLPLTKTENEYEPTTGFLSVSTYFDWLPNWTFNAKEEFTYYVFGKEFVYNFFVWDGSGEWTNYYRTESLYGPNRNVELFTEYVWDVISVIFVNFKKTEYKYDGFDNMYSAVYSTWVKQLQDFLLVAKEDCFYENLYTNSDLLLPPGIQFSESSNRLADNEIYFHHMLKDYSYFLHNGVRFELSNDRKFYYSPKNITVSTKELAKNIQIYPNPAYDYFNIVQSESNTNFQLKLYDVHGKQKFSKKLLSNEIISTENLPNGMYVYHLVSDNGKIYSGKLILQTN